MGRYKKNLERLDILVKIVCSLLFITIFILIILQILSRYLIQSPLVWTEELSRVIFIWVCFLGGTIVHRNRTHIGIDYFVSKLPRKARNIIALAINLGIIIFLLIFAAKGYELAIRGKYLSLVTIDSIKWSHIYYSVPISSIIMLLYSIEETIKLYKGEEA